MPRNTALLLSHHLPLFDWTKVADAIAAAIAAGLPEFDPAAATAALAAFVEAHGGHQNIGTHPFLHGIRTLAYEQVGKMGGGDAKL